MPRRWRLARRLAQDAPAVDAASLADTRLAGAVAGVPRAPAAAGHPARPEARRVPAANRQCSADGRRRAPVASPAAAEAAVAEPAEALGAALLAGRLQGGAAPTGLFPRAAAELCRPADRVRRPRGGAARAAAGGAAP